MNKVTLQEFMSDENNFYEEVAHLRKRAKCADGFSVSIQASRYHYCEPRQTFSDKFESLELGYPSKKDKLIMPYAELPERPKRTVYCYVPWDVVKKLVKKHGGIVGVDLSSKM